ncbi:Tat pathway signal sequence domain-containing protein [Penicillium herquei]|nr:Tat pathway signal sequence domain-containing protein [Penicillium herquei]
MWLFKTWLWTTLASATLVSGASYPNQQGHAGKKRNVDAHLGTFLHNRISPNYSELYIAEADGSNEKLLLGSNTVYDFRASWSPDASYVYFTSERRGDGQSDIYRVAINGTSTIGATVESIALSPGVDDSSSVSPDGKTLAYTTTRYNQTSQIMLINLETGSTKNLSLVSDISGAASNVNPNGYFKPTWSPDGEWIVFTSDRNTPWRGHSDGSGWEHTQELSIYTVRPNGSDFRHVSSRSNYTQGSPKFSPDGKRVVFYEMLTEDTYNARLEPELLEGAYLNTSIVSIDFATGSDRIVHGIGDGTKISPSFVTNDVIGYVMKESASNGIYYTSISGKNYTQYQTIPMNTMTPAIRSPAWSPDGKYVIFEKQGPTGGSTSTSKIQYSELWSFDPDWDYRFTDVFPAGARSGCPMMAMSQQMEGPADTNLMRLAVNGTEQVTLFEPSEDMINPSIAEGYNARAYQAYWGPNDTNITFGFGAYFVARSTNPGFIYSINADGSDLTLLAGNNITNYGFPSFNHDGSKVIFRTWPGTADNGTTVGSIGLALYDVNTHTLTQMTTEWDNLPSFSPDGKKVLFTRRTNWNNIGDNYDIFTMDLDGNDLVQVTQSVASDAHAVWTRDGRILYSTAMFGFQQEAPLYDDSMQPYAIIMVMDGDGNNKTPLTNSLWEDAMPMYVPAHILASTC